HVFPTGLEDCAASLAWVVGHIAEHGGDPRRIFIGGHSAGGHYAALLACNAAACAARFPDGRVLGCLPLSGVFDFGPASGLSVRPRFLGADPANDAAASPITHLDGPLPFFVACGTNDFP